MKTIYLLFVILFLATTSCKTKDGEPGAPGEDVLSKQGSMNGTLSYLDYKGDSIAQYFDYQYYESTVDNMYSYNTNPTDSSYYFQIYRRDLKDTEKHFALEFYGKLSKAGIPLTPERGYIDFSYANVVNNNLFAFNDGFYSEGFEEYIYVNNIDTYSTCDITNFSLDTLTGRILFNYTTSYDAGDIEDAYDDFTQAIVKGSIDVTVPRIRNSLYVSPVAAMNSNL